jgi:hypothetical protein
MAQRCRTLNGDGRPSPVPACAAALSRSVMSEIQ